MSCEIKLDKFEEEELSFAPILNFLIDELAKTPSYADYHQFVDACLGKDEVSAPFSYSSRLTETILLGVIAGRFPNKTLHWDNERALFKEEEANAFLSGEYRKF